MPKPVINHRLRQQNLFGVESKMKRGINRRFDARRGESTGEAAAYELA